MDMHSQRCASVQDLEAEERSECDCWASEEGNDTDLLDALEELAVPEGMGWVMRESATGRGWRLLTSSRTPSYTTAREALKAWLADG